MLSNLSSFSFAVYRTSKPKTLHQRLKFYGKQDNFKLKTIIRPPDLTDPNLQFPIRIPIRYRHQFHLKRDLIVNDTSKLYWERMQPNEVLLAFENIQYLNFKEIVEGLQCLAKINGQQAHDWNKHEWVLNALNKVNENFIQIKKNDIMNFYFLMKKLGYLNQQFWNKLYAKIEENIYDLNSGEFSYIYVNYYHKFEQYFSPEARGNFNKLMQGRIREFSPQLIVKVFQFYLKDQKIDGYWLQNVFASLFKDVRYIYQPNQIAQIFRSLMILGHENNDRLYANLYQRMGNVQFKSLEEIDLLKEVLEEIKQIFTSHRVEPSLEMLASKREKLEQKLKETSLKTIEQMVRDDLTYFVEKRKLKKQEKGESNNV